MGRKKIKIRPIKDDRNRAVTFLKRKNGLFKKAFELAVLCRAEVAVIVFAGNKKLYEFASSDMKDVLYRYTQAEPYEHRGPEDFANKEDGDSDDSDDMGMDASPEYHHRVMSHTPQPHGTPQFHRHIHDRNPSEDSIGSGPRRSSMHTPQLLPHHRTPPLHPRQNSLQHIDTPPQQFQVPMIPGHGSPQPTTSAVRGIMQQQPMHHGVGQDGMGLGIGMTTPQPYGMQYNPYGQQQHVYLSAQDPPRRPSSNPTYQYTNQQENPYQPSPPLRSMSHPSIPPPQSEPQPTPPLPSQPQVTEIKSTSKRIKSINTPVSSRASSLAAHFDTSRAPYDRPPPPPLPPGRSHSVDSSAQHQIVSNMPLSHSPPPIATNTPGSNSNSAGGGRPKLSLHIPDDEDPTQQGEESGGEATPGTASPEVQREDSRQEITKRGEHNTSDVDRDRNNTSGHESFFLPPPSSSSQLPNGRLPGPGLGAFDNSNNSGGTPLSALPSRYAGDMLPSPSTFYPEFYGSLPSAGTSNVRGGFGGLMNGTPIVSRSDETFASYGGGNNEKRRSEDGLTGGINKRARN